MKREHDFLYVSLYKTLKEQILTGLIQPGDYLLPEAELCKQYNMSRNSVRKALDELQKDGLIVKKVGIGTMVSSDLNTGSADRKSLHILAPFPSFFVEYGLPVICESFRRQYPHVDIRVLSLPVHTYWESLKQVQQMGVHPDIVMVDHTLFSAVGTQASFLDLNPNLGARLDEIYPRIRNAFCRNGAAFAAPAMFTPLCLAYNPQLFETHGVPLPDPNWRIEQFVDAAEKLTMKSDGKYDCIGFTFTPGYSRWSVFALQNGFRPSGTNNRQTIIKALSLLQDLLHRRRVALLHQSTAIPENPFVYGKAAMSLTTLFEVSHWQEQGIEFVPQMASLPFGDTKATLIQSNALAIPASCRNPQLAMAFLETALQGETQRTMCNKTQFLSVIPAVNEAARTAEYLRAINVADNEMMDHNYFVNELVEETNLPELSNEMSLFWLGLEDAESVAERSF